MDSKELRRVQGELIDAAKEIATLPLEALWDETQKFDTLGSMFDPTNWIRKKADVEQLRKILEPALQLKRAMVEARDEAMKVLAEDPALMMEAMEKEGARLERRRAYREAQEAGR